MTVTTTNSRITYVGDGITTVFPFPYYFLLATDLVVYFNSALQTTGYSVSGAGQDSGGIVAFSVPPPVGTTIILLRDPDRFQNTKLPPNDPFPAKAVETGLDKLTMLVQRIYDRLTRIIQFPDTDTNSMATLPPASARVGQLMGFDAFGNPSMYPITASVGAGDMRVDTFTAGSDFTTNGTTTQLTLSRAPGNPANLEIFFDIGFQGPDQWTLSGNVVTFTSAIPAGIQKVFARIGTTLSTQITPDESITDAKISSSNTVLDAIVNKLKFLAAGTGAIYRALRDKLRDRVHIKDYGALGDGVTPASAAIQAAINTGAGRVWVSGGTYLINTTIELRDNLIIEFDKDAKFIPATDNITIFKASTHAYFSQIRSATLDGNGKVGITGFDLQNFRLQAGLYECYVTNMTNGAVFRTGCFGAKVDGFTAYNGVPNPITCTENCAVIDIINPRLDNETGAGAGTGNGISVQAVGIPNEGVRITGGYIQGFQYGVLDNGLGTRISETYFEQCALGDVFFNGARNSSARDTQHFAAIGAAAFKGRNCDGITIWNPDAGSGARTALYDFDSTCSNCNEYRAGSNAGYNSPTGSLTYLAQLASRSTQSFTPTIAGSSTIGVGTYTAQDGRISLHGGYVEIAGTIGWTAHSGSGPMTINGIPAGFAPASYSPRRIAQLEVDGIAYTGPGLYAYFNGSGTQLSVAQVSTAGATTLLNLPSTGTLHFKLSYDSHA